MVRTRKSMSSGTTMAPTNLMAAALCQCRDEERSGWRGLWRGSGGVGLGRKVIG